MLHIFVLFIASTLMFTACTKTNDPAMALKEYVDMRFSTKEINKKDVLEKLSGSLYDEISNMSEDDFKNFQTKNLKKRSFRILSTKCSTTECFVTYSVKYDSFGDNDGKLFSSEIKKIAQLQQSEGHWKIVDVNNIKTFHNSKKALEIQ